MNGPNKTVAAARARKWAKLGQMAFNTREQADFYAAPFVAEGKRVVVRPFRVGPRHVLHHHYSVTVYDPT